MAGSRRLKKQYEVPRKKWDKARIAEEKELKATYGLKNKRELRKLETTLRRKRENARKMLALGTEERGGRDKQLMQNLDRTGLLKSNATLDDVLSLTVKELLERRLQTIVWRKNLANTPIQARQFITHGHIAVNGRKMNCPGYLVTRDDEGRVAYFGKPMVIKVEKKAEKKAVPVGGADAAMPAEGAVGKPAEAPVAEAPKPKEAKAEVKAEEPKDEKPKEKVEEPKAGEAEKKDDTKAVAEETPKDGGGK